MPSVSKGPERPQKDLLRGSQLLMGRGQHPDKIKILLLQGHTRTQPWEKGCAFPRRGPTDGLWRPALFRSRQEPVWLLLSLCWLTFLGFGLNGAKVKGIHVQGVSLLLKQWILQEVSSLLHFYFQGAMLGSGRSGAGSGAGTIIVLFVGYMRTQTRAKGHFPDSPAASSFFHFVFPSPWACSAGRPPTSHVEGSPGRPQITRVGWEAGRADRLAGGPAAWRSVPRAALSPWQEASWAWGPSRGW